MAREMSSNEKMERKKMKQRVCRSFIAQRSVCRRYRRPFASCRLALVNSERCGADMLKFRTT